MAQNISGGDMNNFTEILIATGIIGILLVVAGFGFQGWVGKYRTESQILQLYTDVMHARQESSRTNKKHFLRFPDRTSYMVYKDNGDNHLDIDEDQLVPGFPKEIPPPDEFTLGSASASSFTLNFDRRGMSSALRTFCIFTDFDGDGVSDYGPDYDCMIVHWTRVNKGKLIKQDTAGGKCSADNCRAL